MTSWTSMAAESDRQLRWILDVERAVEAERPTRNRRDDLVQETMLRVWSRLRVTGDVDRPRGLIRTVLRHLRVDRLRAPTQPESLETEVDGRESTPLDAAALTELRQLVRNAIDQLPTTQRDVVRQRIYDGRSFREIAVAQDVPIGTALGRMHVAMKRLRATLERAVVEGAVLEDIDAND